MSNLISSEVLNSVIKSDRLIPLQKIVLKWINPCLSILLKKERRNHWNCSIVINSELCLLKNSFIISRFFSFNLSFLFLFIKVKKNSEMIFFIFLDVIIVSVAEEKKNFLNEKKINFFMFHFFSILILIYYWRFILWIVNKKIESIRIHLQFIIVFTLMKTFKS